MNVFIKVFFTFIVLNFSVQTLAQNAFFEAMYLSKIDTADLRLIIDYYNKTKDLNQNSVKRSFSELADLTQDSVALNNEITALENQIKSLSSKDPIKESDLKQKKKQLINKEEAIAVKEKEILKKKAAKFLSRKEEQQLLNLIAFIKDPWDNTLIPIDMSVIGLIIQRYNKEALVSNRDSDGAALASGGALTLLPQIPGLITGTTDFSERFDSVFWNGLTLYIAEEFKKGVTVSYLQLFEQRLDAIGELRIFFPETYDLLKNSDPFDFPDFGETWKETFHSDLKKILINTVNYIDSSPPTAMSQNILLTPLVVNNLKANPNFQYLKITVDILDKLIQKHHPVDIINYLDIQYYLNTNYNSTLRDIIHFANLIQDNLRDTSKIEKNQLSKTWINVEQLNQLNTVEEIKIFVGLIYQQDRSFFNRIGLFNSDPGNIVLNVKQRIFPTIIAVQQFLIQFQEHEHSKKDKLYDGEFIQYMEAFLNLLESINTAIPAVTIPPKAITISNKSLEIYKSIYDKDFDLAIENMIVILNELWSEEITALHDNPNFLKIVTTFNKYGNFMVEMTNVENSEEMKEVLAKHVASPSTFIKKRSSTVTLSVNSHPGYYFSLEKFRDIPDAKYKINTGLTLPIGFDFAFGLTKESSRIVKSLGGDNATKEFSGFSLGGFVQLIDLGAILNVRLDGDTNDLPDEVKWEQLFSPGFTLNLGLKNTPVTIGLGYQLTPELREIGGPNNFEKADRWLLRVTWDIPLINIYSSNFKH